MQKPALVPDEIDALVFDVIGTLVDEDRTWVRAAERLTTESGLADTVDLYRAWVDRLDRAMSAIADGDAPWQPHSQLVSDSARDAVASLGGDLSADALASVSFLDREYPAWPDVAPATAALRRDRLVAGVSNGDLDSLARLANTNAISWDIAVSTGAAQTFKPAPAAYAYAIDTLRIDPTRTLFVAAHPWDLRAAAEHGFRTAYVARPGADRPTDHDRFDVTVDDLLALVELLAGRAADAG